MPTPLTTTGRLERFKKAGMILGGCDLDAQGEPVETNGWLSRFAEIIGMDRGNLNNVLRGARTLTDAMEAKLEVAVREWRDRQIPRVRTALMIAAQIDAEHNAAREAERLAAAFDLDNDGPAPGFGG